VRDLKKKAVETMLMLPIVDGGGKREKSITRVNGSKLFGREKILKKWGSTVLAITRKRKRRSEQSLRSEKVHKGNSRRICDRACPTGNPERVGESKLHQPRVTYKLCLQKTSSL